MKKMAKPIVAPPMSTVIDSSGASKDYSPSQLALKLHTLPHLDLTFQRVNSSFNPDLYRYREAILFWSIVPLVWMFLTMLVVVMYFCYHCCQSDVQKAGVCLKWSIAVLALLSCGAVGAGFYGNEETHKGLQHFIDAAKGIQFTTSQTRAQIKWMEVNLNYSVISLANDLRSNIPRSHSLRTEINQHLDRSVRHVTSIISSVLDIGFKVKRIDSTIELVHYAGRYGFYRWLAMVLLFSWMMVLFVILLFAVGKGSKYLMLAFGILSIVSLILCWLAAGLHLGVIIGTADFCIAPLAYLEQMTEEKSDREIIKYYMKCDHQFVDNPFKNTIPSTYDNAREANISLAKVHMSLLKILPNSKEKEVVRDKMKKIFKGMDSTFQLLMHINALVECTNLHKDYLDGVSGICFNGLDGMVFLLVSIGLTGIFFTGVVLLTSGSWRSFTSGRSTDQNVLRQLGSAMTPNEEGPFVVQPDGSSMNPAYFGNSSKSIRRASDILFRGFLPGFRPPNILGDPMASFKRNLVATPLIESSLSPHGYNNEANGIAGNSRLHEDNL